MLDDMGCTCYSSGADEDCPKHSQRTGTVIADCKRAVDNKLGKYRAIKLEFWHWNNEHTAIFGAELDAAIRRAAEKNANRHLSKAIWPTVWQERVAGLIADIRQELGL